MITVEQLLEQKQLSIEQAAELAKMDVERVEAIVVGRWTPSPKERKRLADALATPADQIAWGHTMPPRNVRYHQYGLKEDIRAKFEPDEE